MLSNVIKQHLKNWFLKTSISSTFSGLELGLHASELLPDNSNPTELSCIDYSRQSVIFTNPDNLKLENSNNIRFPNVSNMTENCGAVTAFGIYDDVGTLLFTGTSLESKLLDINLNYFVEAGFLEISLDNTTNFSEYFTNALLNWMFHSNTFLMPPTNFYIGLHNNELTPYLFDYELTNPGYFKQNVNFQELNNSNENGIILGNSSPIVFSRATTDWGSIKAVSIWADSNPIMYENINPITISVGDQLEIDSLTMQIK